MKRLHTTLALVATLAAATLFATASAPAAQGFVGAPTLAALDIPSVQVFATIAAPAPILAPVLAEVTTPASPFTDPTTLPSPLASIIALATPLLIWTVKLLVPKINTRWLPLIAGGVGLILALGAHYLVGLDVTWWQGLLLGGIGVWLRELVDQLKQPAHTVESNNQPSSG